MPHKLTETHLLGCLLLSAAASMAAHAQTPAQNSPAPRSIDLLVTVTDTPEAGPVDTGKNTYIPGSEVIYTVLVRNRGAQAVKGVAVKGALPAGITQARWVCAASSGGACGAAAGSGALNDQVVLAPRATATYLVTLTVPTDYPRSQPTLIYSVSLTPAPGDLDVAPNNLSAADIDAPRPPGTSAPLETPAIGAGAGGVGSPSQRGRPLLGGRLGEAPFTCDPTMYVSAGATGSSPSTLLTINTNVTPFGSTSLGTAAISYNALGFNPIDNFLYAFENGTNKLYQIHSDGTATLVGVPALAGAPGGVLPTGSYTAGEIAPNGTMYIKEGSSANVLYTIDLTASPLTAKKLTTTGKSLVGAADLAWIDGLLYAVVVDMTKDTATVATVNLTSMTVTYLPTVNKGFTNNVGALFGSSAGLYGVENTGSVGTFFEFDLKTGKATKLSTTNFAVGSSDGAHCATAPVNFTTDLQVTKTNTPAQGPNDLPNDTYVPGTVVYTIVVTNNGPTGVQNALVRDPLPAGITAGSWTCSVTGNGECGASSGTGGIVDAVDLEVGDTATYLLTLTVPANYPITHPQLINTVTISMPPGFIAANPSHLTATDSDPAAADLAILKTTSAASVAVGAPITYTLVVSNQGKSDVANAILTDVPDSRLDCTAASPNVSCTATGAAQCPAGVVTVASLLGGGITIPLLPAGSDTATFTMTCKVTSAQAAKSAAKTPKPK